MSDTKITDDQRRMVRELSAALERSLMLRGMYHQATSLVHAAKAADARSVAAGFTETHWYGVDDFNRVNRPTDRLGHWFQMDIEVWEQMAEVLRVAAELLAAESERQAEEILDGLVLTKKR